MRVNKFIAQATGMSRRAADGVITDGRVEINERIAQLGDSIKQRDIVTLDGEIIRQQKHLTIMLNKPVGYVCSRDGQGSQTIYDLLPEEYQQLKPVGRLDKDSSGLLLLTNDGDLAQELTHPSQQKDKVYEVSLDKPLTENDKEAIEQGIKLEDGPSKLQLKGQGKNWTVTMHEGRNRQIRRTFEALGYKITKLHRTQFGSYKLKNVESGSHQKS